MGKRMDGKRSSARKVGIRLPAHIHDEIQGLAKRHHRSMTELARDGFALAMIAYEQQERGNKLAVVDGSGRIVKELVVVR